MDNNALKFPAYFPAKCPPEEATDEECVLFRLCKNLTLTEQDFVSFYLINPQKHKDNINAYGLSVFRSVDDLFMAANDKDRLREFLSTQNPRVAVKYRALLQSLLSSKTGIKINNASPNNETFIKHFSTKELSSNLILINSEIEEIVEPITVCGRLVGANVERCSFEFITVSNESIKGQLTPALSSSVFSVPQSVEADIEIRIGSDSMTREEKLLYTLTAIRPIVPQSETEI